MSSGKHFRGEDARLGGGTNKTGKTELSNRGRNS